MVWLFFILSSKFVIENMCVNQFYVNEIFFKMYQIINIVLNFLLRLFTQFLEVSEVGIIDIF